MPIKICKLKKITYKKKQLKSSSSETRVFNQKQLSRLTMLNIQSARVETLLKTRGAPWRRVRKPLRLQIMAYGTLKYKE